MKKYKIDKSQLKFGTRPKIKDDAYLKSYKDRHCLAAPNGIDVCGLPAIAAHVRAGEVAGMGTKPSDDLTYALCTECHRLQEENPGEQWWFENCFKPMLRRKYRGWINDRRS